MEFWTRQADHEEWRSIPLEGATLPAGDYAILTRSPQPHFTISVDVYRSAPQAEDKVLHQQRFTRTNEEGLGEILPLTPLEPGRWEFHCRDGDLIAELFGENQSDVLCVEIYPSTPISAPGEPAHRDRSIDPGWSSRSHSPLAEPEPSRVASSVDRVERKEPQPDPQPDLVGKGAANGSAVHPPSPPPDTDPSSRLFSLMHSRLQGAPGEVLVLTGRIECSGDLEARVYNQKQLVFENQRTIRLPGDARSAVFSIQVPLPASPWSSPLIGTLTLRGLVDGSHSSLTFTVNCVEPKNGAGSSAPLRSPLLSKAPQEIPISQYRDPLPTPSDVPSVSPPPQAHPLGDRSSSPLPSVLEQLDRSDLSGADALFTARTLRKMLQICHDDLEIDSSPVDPAPAAMDSGTNGATSGATTGTTNGTTNGATSAAIHNGGPAHPGPEDPSSTAAELPSSPAQEPLPQPSLAPDPDLDLDHPDSDGDPSLWAAAAPLEESPSLDPLDLDPVEQQLPQEPQTPPVRWSVVSTLPREKTEIARDRGRAAEALGERFQPQTPPQELPLPEIWVPETVQGGETVDVVIRLYPPEENMPLWIKLWLKQDRTRSILDGPRWLLDFTRTDQGYLQAITRMTIPHGSGEIVFEAWAVTSDLARHGERTLLRRSVQS